MLSLVYKDMAVQKKSLWMVLFYSLFMHAAMFSMEGGAYVAVAIAVAYIFILGACAQDEKNKSEIVLNSLPVSREEIVVAKYLTALLFLIIGMGASGLTGAVLKLAGFSLVKRFISCTDIVAMFISISLLFSVYYPVYFKFGYLKARYVNLFIFMLFFFGPALVLGLLEGKREMPPLLVNFIDAVGRYPDSVLFISVIAVACILALLSLLVSITFYRHREFA